MTDTNAASVWVVESKLLETADKEYEWGDCMSFTSILMEECNGEPLFTRMGLDNTFDLGYVRAVEYAHRMGKMYSATQYFRVVLKNSTFDKVEEEFVFKGKTRNLGYTASYADD
jgi:hypothetical protein